MTAALTAAAEAIKMNAMPKTHFPILTPRPTPSIPAKAGISPQRILTPHRPPLSIPAKAGISLSLTHTLRRPTPSIPAKAGISLSLTHTPRRLRGGVKIRDREFLGGGNNPANPAFPIPPTFPIPAKAGISPFCASELPNTALPPKTQ